MQIKDMGPVVEWRRPVRGGSVSARWFGILLAAVNAEFPAPKGIGGPAHEISPE
jgi:hypothetical protein